MRARTSFTFTTSTRHQWLKTPKSNESKLLDSQTITPGEGFTLEMIYGSGNRNLTAGDSIFHCHFYPHFAAGLWAIWRVHDVFEEGTELGKDGRPLPRRPCSARRRDCRGDPDPRPGADARSGDGPDSSRHQAGGNPGRSARRREPGAGAGLPCRARRPLVDAGGTPATHSSYRAKRGTGAFNLPWTSPRRVASDSTAACPEHVVVGGTVVYEKHNILDFTKENITRGAGGQVTEGSLQPASSSARYRYRAGGDEVPLPGPASQQLP